MQLIAADKTAFNFFFIVVSEYEMLEVNCMSRRV